MYCSFYLRNGVAFVPTMGKTEAGYWLGVEPVDVLKVETVAALQTSLLAALRRGNPIVPTPTRRKFPPDVMRRYCGMKSFSAFDRTARCWSIARDGNEYCVAEWRHSSRYPGAREEALETKLRLPGDTPLEEVALRAAEVAFSRMGL